VLVREGGDGDGGGVCIATEGWRVQRLVPLLVRRAVERGCGLRMKSRVRDPTRTFHGKFMNSCGLDLHLLCVHDGRCRMNDERCHKDSPMMRTGCVDGLEQAWRSHPPRHQRKNCGMNE
jgi:hypothetical protein